MFGFGCFIFALDVSAQQYPMPLRFNHVDVDVEKTLLAFDLAWSALWLSANQCQKRLEESVPRMRLMFPQQIVPICLSLRFAQRKSAEIFLKHVGVLRYWTGLLKWTPISRNHPLFRSLKNDKRFCLHFETSELQKSKIFLAILWLSM